MKGKLGIGLGWLIFLGGLFVAWFWTGPGERPGEGPVQVVCINTIGDADSTLLCQQGAAVLIDTGDEQDAEHILEILRQYQVKKLDYLILSHYDSDHIGGAQTILEQIPVGIVVAPDQSTEDERVIGLKAYLEEEKIPILYPVRTHRMSAGQMQLVVYPPLERHYNDNNNYSLAVLTRHQKVNMMFAGDALRKRSEELLHIDWPSVDLYKVAHHGRENAATGELFDRLTPVYGVVTEKRADQAVLEGANRNHTELFYTGWGDCRFLSDGEQLVFEGEGRNENLEKE